MSAPYGGVNTHVPHQMVKFTSGQLRKDSTEVLLHVGGETLMTRVSIRMAMTHLLCLLLLMMSPPSLRPPPVPAWRSAP
jgi:hypothetical protein